MDSIKLVNRGPLPLDTILDHSIRIHTPQITPAAIGPRLSDSLIPINVGGLAGNTRMNRVY
jgi:hypothetical protein